MPPKKGDGTMNINFKDVLIVVLGGLFGYTLGKLPQKWVWAVLAAAIALAILAVNQ